VDIEADIDDISLGIDVAVPVSLIVNELVTNALKYAFPNERRGTVWIRARIVEPDTIELRVEDDGIGMPPGFDIRASDSLGMQLVCGLTQQIHGELEVTGNHGTSFVIAFPGSA
jgi:two-component sensor histidine kinase